MIPLPFLVTSLFIKLLYITSNCQLTYKVLAPIKNKVKQSFLLDSECCL